MRELYYAELRQEVLWSQSRHQEALFFQLAARAVQADDGDVELGERNDEKSKQRLYFLTEDYFSPRVRAEKVPIKHGAWGGDLMLCTADKASWTRLSPPVLSCVTRRAERPHSHPGHPTVYKRSQQSTGWSGHILQDEKGRSHQKEDSFLWNHSFLICCFKCSRKRS